MITDFLSVTCEGICEQLFQAKGFFFLRFILIAKNRESYFSWRKNKPKIERDFHSFVLVGWGHASNFVCAYLNYSPVVCVCWVSLFSWLDTATFRSSFCFCFFFLLQRYAFTRVVTNEDPRKKSSRICLDNWKVDESFSEMERESQ